MREWEGAAPFKQIVADLMTSIEAPGTYEYDFTHADRNEQEKLTVLI